MNFMNQNFRFYSPSVDSPLISYPYRIPKHIKSTTLSQFPAVNNNHHEFTNFHYDILFSNDVAESSSPVGSFYLNNESFPASIKSTISEENTSESLFGDLITAHINPFLEELKQLQLQSPQQDVIQQHLNKYANAHKKSLCDVMQALKVKKLILPFVESDLPLELISEFHQIEQQNPGQAVQQLMENLFGSKSQSASSSSSSSDEEVDVAESLLEGQLRALEVFMARFDTVKEVLSLLVFSHFDDAWICFPASMGQPPPDPLPIPPYPLCAQCHKAFGLHPCPHCTVVKYCSPHCAKAAWEPQHHNECPTLCRHLLSHSILTIEP